jgi:hypothetical protein
LKLIRSGETLTLPGPGRVRVKARAVAQVPLERFELIHNGRLMAKGEPAPDRLSHELNSAVHVTRSG